MTHKDLEKRREYLREYYATHLEEILAYTREYDLVRRHGITSAERDAMFAAQGSKCACCGADSPKGKWGTWHIDHDHISGAIRGLLCNKCNTGLGMLGDSEETLGRAIEYLRRARENPPMPPKISMRAP